MILIDGDTEEGGGQILRSSVMMSCHTGKAFTIDRIRARRSTPGLRAQHLAGVHLARLLTDARVEGAEIGSQRLAFEPRRPAEGNHFVDVGTAGSLSLLLQSTLLASLTSGQRVELELSGGTDVQWAPPCDYLGAVLLPYFSRLGHFEYRLLKRGFHPKGRGQLQIQLQGSSRPLEPLDLTQRPTSLRLGGRSVACESLRDRRVAERQAAAARQIIPELEIEVEYARTASVGSVLTLWGQASGTWPFRVGADQLGSKGLPAEEVGTRAARLLEQRLGAPQPVEEHLADNLIPFLALFGGRMSCQEVTAHTRGNAYVMEQFLPVKFHIGPHEVACEPS